MKSKLIYFYRLGLLFIFLIIISCQDVLDVKNLNAIDPEIAWNDPALADAYLTNLYDRVMPNGWPARSGALYGGLAVDDSRGVINENTIQITSHPWSGSFEKQYTDIRQINILLEEIESGELEKEVEETITGQAYFLRAYSYFLLVRIYGGVPLILTPQTLEDDLKVKRSSTIEVFKQIENDLEEALELIGDQTFANSDKGRIGKAAILAFKGRVALYKASPLFNPDNPYGNTFWEEAYNVNLQAKEELDAMGFGLNDNYGDIWSINNKGNQEAILTVKFDEPDKTDGRYEQAVRPLSQSANATGSDNPVWSLLEAYPMKDGFPIGESSTYAYQEQTFWKNRDPRFNATIVYNGSIYETSGINGRRQYTDNELATSDDAYTTDPNDNGHTGLYTRKGMQPELKRAEVSQNSVDWIEIRYAEVLLNLAEAANEVGETEDAILLIKKLRNRAGIEEGNGDYGVIANNKQEVRELIYRERFVEFVFEGQRFWDLKRSRTLTELDGLKEKGVQSTLKPQLLPVDQNKKDNFEYLPEDFNYVIETILKASASSTTFSIPSNFYFAPIPISQIQKNSNLQQNEEWGGDFIPTIQ